MVKKNKFAFFLLICFAILLVLSIYSGYAENNYNYWSIAANLIFVLVMALTIFQQKKEK